MVLDRPIFRLFLKTRKGKIGMNKRGFIGIDVKYKSLILANKLMRISEQKFERAGGMDLWRIIFFPEWIWWHLQGNLGRRFMSCPRMKL